MKGVILDADSLGKGQVDLSDITRLLDEWDIHGTTRENQIVDRIRDATIVLSNKVMLDESAIAVSPALRMISVMATGTNNVDLAAASANGVVVSNAVAYATPSVVQHTINLILALATNLQRFMLDVRSGQWQKSPSFCLLDHPIVELSGKTLGIVGYGELGSSVAEVARAFGMKILVAKRPALILDNASVVTLEQLLKKSDFVSLHCPLTPETKGLINLTTLSMMKPTAFIVNTARGGLINDDDLIYALKNGVIKGAALDVLDNEPPDGNDLLATASLPNLLVTPHNAWGAIEARERLVVQMGENIEAFLAGLPIRQVNRVPRTVADNQR